ncbi:MAG TPA: SDR family oxidoreductase [Gallionellaceae bacterium]|nr:SDR family oxidoreductase [Gallionellaceae bacterium]
MTSRILISGASGFVGQAVCTQAERQGWAIRAALRKPGELPDGVEPVVVGEISGVTDWTSALRDVDVVIHLAARVHVMCENAENPLEEFRKVNVAGTEHLARSAAASGVKRLVFVSSIKVNGEGTFPVSSSLKKIPPSPSTAKCETLKPVFSDTDEANPQDPYGVSKWEAEQVLQRVAAETGLEVVIVRPPLIYGAGVKGNFAQMLKVLAKGIPLPLASVCNLRSLVFIGNFVDALLTCATHPAASGQTYLVSDGEDVSTPDLLRQLGAAMGCPARLLPCPPALLRLAGRLFGKSDQIDRLLGSLQVDGSKIRRELGWQPPFSLQEGLRLTVVP